MNNNAVKAYRGTPVAQNNPGGSPLFHHERSRRGFQTSSTSIVSSGPDGKYTPLHNDASNAQRLLKNGRNSTAREMFLTLDEKMNVSFSRGFLKHEVKLICVVFGVFVNKTNAFFSLMEFMTFVHPSKPWKIPTKCSKDRCTPPHP